jgi:hypothetical protein
MLPKIKRIQDLTTADNGKRAYVRAQLGNELDRKDCATCPQAIWINVFFDGTGNNFDKDEKFEYKLSTSAQSNIAKLAYFCWPIEDLKLVNSDTPKARYRIYVPGVGTEFKEIHDTGGIDKAFGNAAALMGEERIDWALKNLKKAVANHTLVKKINVAIFGFSRGATLARAFARKLGAECKLNGNQLTWTIGCNVPLEIYFMGILDTVASVGYGGSVAEVNARRVIKYTSLAGYFLMDSFDKGGHYAWADDISIPAYVTRCVHYVAAHEVREKFPSDTVKQSNTIPANAVEVVFPGMHSDIGGGYLPSSQEARTNELSRITLNNMYCEAWKAGVPLRSPTDITKTYPGLFDISSELEASFNEYMKPIKNGSLEQQVIQHMNLYYSWRCARQRRLDGKKLIPPGGVDKWMAITDKEFNDDVKNIAEKKTGLITTALDGIAEEVIYKEYHQYGKQGYRSNLSAESQAMFDLFFDKYVHDSVAGFKNQMSDAYISGLESSRYTYTRTYFVGKKNGSYYLWRYKGWTPQLNTYEQQAMNTDATNAVTAA